MSGNPIGIGSTKAQARFLKENQSFVEECPKLFDMIRRTFIRTLAPPSAEDVKKVEGLPEDSGPAKDFFQKQLAEKLVFYLGRIAADDFGELLILAGNGYGFGALKILRTLYEHVVTAAFIAKNPSEAEPFTNDSAIKKGKLWKRAVEWMPDIVERYTPAQLEGLENAYKEALSRYKATTCSKCGQPVTQEAWTRRDLETMAKAIDDNLAVLYGSCYLEPLCHSHATAFGLELRLIETEDAVTYREESPDEAKKAIMFAHNLIWRVLALQNSYFNLGLDSEIKARADKFSEIWDKKAEGEG